MIRNIQITVNPTPNIDAGNPQTVCSNDIVNLSPTFSNIDPATVSWSSSSQGLEVLLSTFQLTRQALQTFLMDRYSNDSAQGAGTCNSRRYSSISFKHYQLLL